MEIIPKTGLKGLKENWQSDLIAAVSVALVALPLALGIAIASEVPPISGILSVAIGGIVTTFFKGSHLAINGPAAGLIAVILTSLFALDNGDGQQLNYVLAAIVVSGALQVLLGLFKLGRFGDLFHPSVIHGILATIGVIIFAKQIHIAFGTQSDSTNSIDIITDFFYGLTDINPIVAIISITGLILLIFHSRINYKLFHFLPAPFWVLIISIPFVYFFDFFNAHSINLLGNEYAVGPKLLINIPDNLLDALVYPNFSRVNTVSFWMAVASITTIASIQTLAMAKAVDKLDPYKRKTDLNKDLVGVGIATMISGALGGLPIITVIVRSTVNVHNRAKTKWSNFYHGLIMLIFIFLLAPVIQQIPLAALAVILVYTGFKLASPKILKRMYAQGIEQLIFFIGTLIITLATDNNLLFGIIGGMCLVLLTHILLARVPTSVFFKMAFNSGTMLHYKKDGSYNMEMKGVANFLSIIRIDKLLNEIKPGANVNIDLANTRLVDATVLENLHDFVRKQENSGAEVTVQGLDEHVSSSHHKLALKIKNVANVQHDVRAARLLDLADAYSWTYQNRSDKDIHVLESFYFFKSRPIKRQYHCITSRKKSTKWQVSDVLFGEGAYLAQEDFKTTLALVTVSKPIPKFTIEKKGLLDKYLPHHKDIDFTIYQDFSDTFSVKVEDVEAMKAFLTDDLRALIEESDIHHLESNGESILIFNDSMRLTRIQDYPQFVEFAEAMCHNL